MSIILISHEKVTAELEKKQFAHLRLNGFFFNLKMSCKMHYKKLICAVVGLVNLFDIIIKRTAVALT